MLVFNAGVYIGEDHIRILEFGQEVLMDDLLKLNSEALHHCIHLFCHFVANDEFALSLDGHNGGNVISILTQIKGWMEGILKALDVDA